MKLKLKDRFGWLFRHYGVRRVFFVALALPIYHAARLVVTLAVAAPGPSGGPIDRLTTGVHDLWFGFWAATLATPVLWIVSYRFSVVQVRWGFRAIAFTWLFDGVVAIAEGAWLLGDASLAEIAATARSVAWLSLYPAALAFTPWALMEAWDAFVHMPLYKRWRYSGIEPHAEWISPGKLRRHTQPLPTRNLL